MAKFIVSLDGQLVKEYEINKERLTIGRKPHNDIQIDNLAVSGEHAMIMTILNDSFLEDLGSTNGTLVNGQPVKKHFLQNNDVIEIGKYKLKYVNEQPSKMNQQEFEKTMVLRTPPADAPKQKGPSDTQSTPHFVATNVEPAGRAATSPAAAAAVAQAPQVPQPSQAAPAATGQPAGSRLSRRRSGRSRFCPDRTPVRNCRWRSRLPRLASRACRLRSSRNGRRDTSSPMSRAPASQR
jgi:hypothetical protein